MPSTKPSPASNSPSNQPGSALTALIGEQVIRLLGRPTNLLEVQVRNLWADRYRANVYVGANPSAAALIHSFFLVTDGDGKIVASTPAIQRVF